jgi:hypothetical protein
MEVPLLVSTTLHILVDCQNVVGWELVLNYMRTLASDPLLSRIEWSRSLHGEVTLRQIK